jgi:hypothetical protein
MNSDMAQQLIRIHTFVRFIDYDTFNETNVYISSEYVIGNDLRGEKKHLNTKKSRIYLI